jgi:predicted  nucleic acid-binding Zn-ribbon protein
LRMFGSTTTSSDRIASLKRDLSTLKKEYSDRVDDFNKQMNKGKTEQDAKTENKISVLNARLQSKEKELADIKEELGHCKKVKNECLNI